MARLSVRTRTTTIAVLCFGIASSVAAIALIATLRSSLLEEIDRSLDSRASDIAAQVDSESEFISLGAGIDSDTLAVVFSLDGALFDNTDESADLDVLIDSFDDSDTPFDVSLPHLTGTVGSDNMRAIVLIVPLDPFSPDEFVAEDDYVIYVATTLDSFDRTVSRVSLVAAISTPGLILMVGLLTWLLTARSLAPVDAIRREVDEITSTALDRRVPEPDSKDEIARLATTMNAMLARLETAQKSQTQFVADASHELRNPLASMATRLDVALRHGDQNEWQTTAVHVRQDVDRMHHLIEDLLLLARKGSDATTAEERNSPVDLDDIVLSVVRELSSDARVELDASAVSGALVHGSDDELRRLVTNLLTNALRHADTAVAVALGDDGQAVTLTIDDDGPGIGLSDRERVFQRFVRLDEARDRDAGGTGLGLAISSEIVTRHRGQMRIDDSPTGGARFTVILRSSS